MRKRDPVLLIVGAMVASLLLAFGFSKAREVPTPQMLAAAKMKGELAYDFALPTTDGKTVRLSDLRGHAVVLNFWATSCEPCKVEMPWFVELQKQYGPRGLEILGMAYEPTDVNDIATFAKDMGIDYPILVGGQTSRNALASNYRVDFLPETFYIGRDGRVIEKTIGLQSRNAIEECIRKALGEVTGKVADGPSGGSLGIPLGSVSPVAVKPSLQ